MDTPRETFLQEVYKMVEDYFAESGFSTKSVEHTKQMIDYVVFSSEKAISFHVIQKMSKLLLPNITNRELEMANSLGWIYEMFVAYNLLFDDYIDEGNLRNGKPTWSKRHDHSKSVVLCDFSLMRAITLFTLRRKFSHSASMYVQILHQFFEVDDMFLKGCCLDKNHLIQNIRNGVSDLESFNMETYIHMARLKTSGFVFMLVSLPMAIAGYKVEDNRELYQGVRDICDDLGILITILDDYYDIFRPFTGSDRFDCDIRRGQFSWLFVTAKENSKDFGKIQDLINHYGQDNDESVLFVKAIYETIGIHDLFKIEYEKRYKIIINKTNSTFEHAKEFQECMKCYIDTMMKNMKGDASGVLE